jgi:hypothetical protein
MNALDKNNPFLQMKERDYLMMKILAFDASEDLTNRFFSTCIEDMELVHIEDHWGYIIDAQFRARVNTSYKSIFSADEV